MIIDEDDYFAHYGTPRRSGRYPWGSGGDNETGDYTENMRNMTFLDHVAHLKSKGMTDSEIANAMGMSRNKFQAQKSIEKNAKKQADIAMAQRLADKGMSTNAIATRMGIPESTARTLLAPGAKDKADVLQQTSAMLKNEVDSSGGFIDIGRGVENKTGVSRNRLDTSVEVLKAEGYEVHQVRIRTAIGNFTNMKVLCPPGTTQRDVFLNQDKIQQIKQWSDDGGRNFAKLHKPIALDPKRVGVLYGDEGGSKADGVIYVRPGVKDITLGDKMYAQVRVQVGDGHYLKGMAMYKDDLPEGTDVLFNTNKSPTGNKLDAMKPLQKEPLPFGSIVRQVVEHPGTDKERNISAMNIVSEEGDWDRWSRTLSTQMLSKQSPALAKTQLDMTFEQRQIQYDDIMKLTNPTVRKRLLTQFADSTDSAAVHMKAAALPGQTNKVILPLSTIKETQVYAPGYLNGERVVLIRHPHGGKFEIPELIVNNKNAEGRKLLGDEPRDAIGIHHNVAKQLSGADFDGDTVLVIPNRSGRVAREGALADLKDFDPKSSYPGYPGMKTMRNTQTEMGKISNLITDMSIREAPHSELVRAIKHSMVVIDAEKHGLDYRLSRNDNNIKDLEKKYQRSLAGKGGAATLISRAKSRLDVPERIPRPMSKGGPIDPVTGERVWEYTNRKLPGGAPAMTRTKKLAEAEDAHTLSSGTPIERIYADHSNKLKAMANSARLDAYNTPTSKWVPSAKAAYKNEVASLDSKLNIARSNAPLERQAQLVANAMVKMRRDDDPTMDDDTLKKVKFQCLTEARLRTGADKKDIRITPEEWDAIQAGAISNSKLTQILDKADMETVYKLATPKDRPAMTTAKKQRAQAMLATGYSMAEIADAIGVSKSTLEESVSVAS